MTRIATAHGKIILSGEYAVVFGCRGIAFPSMDYSISVTFDESPQSTGLMLRSVAVSSEHPQWESYVRRIVHLCEAKSGERFLGTISIGGNLPIGKGMGSSTALTIATCRCLLGMDVEESFCKHVEDIVNPGNSGLDFAVIWSNKPVIFKKGETIAQSSLKNSLLDGTTLIDTGTPNEITSDLVKWVREKQESGDAQTLSALETIGQCTERILSGEDIKTVIRAHHRAQIALGVVPESAQKLIAEIEKKGGAAKVLGAGARMGAGGMVLQFH